MAVQSGVQAAIQELEREEKKLKDAIAMLRGFAGGGPAPSTSRGGRRRLSADARKRISEAAKKRWAARRTNAPAIAQPSGSRRGRLSAAARQRIAEAQRKRWA